ncbi:hypothetical protein Rxycam_01962 [Rubrobacter xylanophilus DSM 9941]|uniref:Na+/H+ antiporter subunit E n=1 Tax=Rubrobacter xylanophilus TaxID=49319 RepID=UPI001C63D733|nr:Na+/H+ antiporter subunit E [Rubrobacter xylanophilus]QYJ16131.1 hypothetical protein Rxycam_01962 [Rubrobacter xylanophilus DSM 9941]
MRRSVAYLAALTLIYALVLASFHPWDLALGALLSAALLFAFRRFVFADPPGEAGLLRRALYAVPLCLAILRNILKGTWEVALVTLGLRPLRSPGIVAVPVGERTPAGVAFSALATTLSPGTFLVEVDWERGVMLIHTIDASDPEAVRREHEEFYRRYQREVFP